MSRFDDWGAESKVETVVTDKAAEKNPEEEAPKDKIEVNNTVDEGEDKGEKSDQDSEDPAIKAMKADLFKKREKIRNLKAENARVAEENRLLKTKKELNPDDFDTFEDFESAQKEAEKKQTSAVNPVLTGAIADINKEIAKAGLDVKEVGAALAEMDNLPDQVIIAMADHEETAKIAKWLSENEDDDLAQKAINARTQEGRMRIFDKIADKASESMPVKEKARKNDNGDPVKTITRSPGGGSEKNLSQLSTEDYIAARKKGGPGRFNW